jgi:hypothetical protein
MGFSPAQIGLNPRRPPRSLSVPEKHQLKIARKTLSYSDIGAKIMGGMTKEEAREIIYRLVGRHPNLRENPGAHWHGKQVKESLKYMRRQGESEYARGIRAAHLQSARASWAQGLPNPRPPAQLGLNPLECQNPSITSTIKDVLWKAGIYSAHLSKSGNIFTWKHSFFYTHGGSADKYSNQIRNALEKAGFRCTIMETRNDWKNWPKTSYFVVKFEASPIGQNLTAKNPGAEWHRRRADELRNRSQRVDDSRMRRLMWNLENENKLAADASQRLGISNPRPPSQWWANTYPRVRASYPGASRERVSRITAGIWWNLPESTRKRLIKRYD